MTLYLCGTCINYNFLSDMLLAHISCVLLFSTGTGKLGYLCLIRVTLPRVFFYCFLFNVLLFFCVIRPMYSVVIQNIRSSLSEEQQHNHHEQCYP